MKYRKPYFTFLVKYEISETFCFIDFYLRLSVANCRFYVV
jgi:hypothetical protein